MAGPMEEPGAVTAATRLRVERTAIELRLETARRHEGKLAADLERERQFIAGYEGSIASIDDALAKLGGA